MNTAKLFTILAAASALAIACGGGQETPDTADDVESPEGAGSEVEEEVEEAVEDTGDAIEEAGDEVDEEM